MLWLSTAARIIGNARLEFNVVNKSFAQDFPAPTGGVEWRSSATGIVGAMRSAVPGIPSWDSVLFTGPQCIRSSSRRHTVHKICKDNRTQQARQHNGPNGQIRSPWTSPAGSGAWRSAQSEIPRDVVPPELASARDINTPQVLVTALQAWSASLAQHQLVVFVGMRGCVAYVDIAKSVQQL